MRNVLITGATSGIGKSLAAYLLARGYFVVATGRHLEKVDAWKGLSNVVVSHLDVTDIACGEKIRNLLVEYDIDTVVLNAGAGYVNHDLDEAKEMEAIEVNVAGVTRCAVVVYQYFRAKGSGILCGISSVAGMRGIRHAPAYSASKAYVVAYLEALRYKASKEGADISVVDIRPGFVETPLISGDSSRYVFGKIGADKAAKLIYRALLRKKPVVYVPWWWRWVVGLMRLAPRKIYYKV